MVGSITRKTKFKTKMKFKDPIPPLKKNEDHQNEKKIIENS
jgi:hypothetical protein